MTKDNVDLICSIGELAGLFQKSASLEQFLQQVVSIIAYHMKAAVCSIYLFDEEKNDLVLRATQGLNPDLIGKTRLKLGEGITGTALQEMRPIREAVGRTNPHFRLVAGLAEERYNAFLAVPIIRGLTRVGVIVVQDPVSDYFTDNDTKALRAIAAQLASTIENARLLLSIRAAEPEPPEEGVLVELKLVHGTSAAGGLARGTAAVQGHFRMDEFLSDERAATPRTLSDFQRALAQTESQLEELQRQMEERLADVASLIFSAHLLILKDEQFSGSMAARIQAGKTASAAIVDVVNTYTALFEKSANPALREKVQDVKDLGHRLLHNLYEHPASRADYSGQVIICADILPSDLMKFAAQKASGLVLVGGGLTAHVSILARSLQIPMVIAKEKRLLDLPEGTDILLDADQGNVFIQPSVEVIRQYESLREGRQRAAELEASVRPETYTADGARVTLLANINLLSDLEIARRLKAEGVGLYRSEFPFIVRSDFPSEEEQFRIYEKIAREMNGREVVFRTLDIGGDKMLSYFPSVNESNPFLGLRAVRFSLRYTGIFTQQLRALLRAGEGRRIRIMFPLVSSVDEFVQARDVVNQCRGQLAGEGVAHAEKVELGVMIELPSAVEVASDLAAEADFLCIGSNDLIQYTLAVDRTNQQIADLFVPYHPAILRALKRIAVAAADRGVDLSLCGDLASDEKMLPFLLGIGIRRLSMDARRIPNVQQAVGAIRLCDAEAAADAMLKMPRISLVKEFLYGKHA